MENEKSTLCFVGSIFLGRRCRPGVWPFRHVNPLRQHGDAGRSTDHCPAVILQPSHGDGGDELGQTQSVQFGAERKGNESARDIATCQLDGASRLASRLSNQAPRCHTFYMEPQPYWEPAEDVFIIHYTKTVVAAFGSDEGWDRELGLKTEIVPLTKPFGLYEGNVFQGIVKFDSQPVPFAEVEVEFYNRDQTAQAPTDYMITQTIKADQNGVFTYAAPHFGWWGFAALNEADYKLKTEAGQEKGVELGAVLWVHFEAWGSK